jgi:hypothetical protein
MGQILSGLTALAGLAAGVAPLTGWYGAVGPTRYVDVAIGLLVLAAGLVHVARRAATRLRAADWAALALALALVAAGCALPSRSGGIRAFEVGCGLVAGIGAWLALRLPEANSAKVFSIEGKTMMEITELLADKHGIGMKGKLLGAMPATMYIRPEQLWNMLAMARPRLVLAVVAALFGPRRRADPKR